MRDATHRGTRNAGTQGPGEAKPTGVPDLGSTWANSGPGARPAKHHAACRPVGHVAPRETAPSRKHGVSIKMRGESMRPLQLVRRHARRPGPVEALTVRLPGASDWARSRIKDRGARIEGSRDCVCLCGVLFRDSHSRLCLRMGPIKFATLRMPATRSSLRAAASRAAACLPPTDRPAHFRLKRQCEVVFVPQCHSVHSLSFLQDARSRLSVQFETPSRQVQVSLSLLAHRSPHSSQDF